MRSPEDVIAVTHVLPIEPKSAVSTQMLGEKARAGVDDQLSRVWDLRRAAESATSRSSSIGEWTTQPSSAVPKRGAQTSSSPGVTANPSSREP